MFVPRVNETYMGYHRLLCTTNSVNVNISTIRAGWQEENIWSPRARPRAPPGGELYDHKFSSE